jgi:ribonucleoside-diphosphate reductase alpha subunit
MEAYIKYIKYIKANNHYDSMIQKPKKFMDHEVFQILNYIDDEGYITYNNELDIFLKDLITKFTNLYDYYTNFRYEIYKYLSNYNFYAFNTRIRYNTFFEDITMRHPNDIVYEQIKKILYEIYLFGTTIYKFSDYYNYIKDQLTELPVNKLAAADRIILFEDVFDNDFTANSYKLLILGHLIKKDDIIIESPVNAYMRITLEFTRNLDFINIREIFRDIWYYKYYIPSTPMFYNSLKRPYNMLSSCFILNVEDNIESIGNFYKKLINILKFNSGIGIVLSKIRAKGRPVMKNNTVSKGIFNYIKTMIILSEQFKNYFKKRNTNINITLSIDHPDVLEFLELKLNTKAENGIPHNNLFQTISIPDEFMYRYLTKKPWYLISPEQTINGVHLYDVYGEEYSKLYNEMVNSELIEKVCVDTAEIFNKIVNTMIQTGGPFIFFKDVVNETSNFDEIINGTNLCTEILIPCNDSETACCNIMSLNLKKFAIKKKKSTVYEFDFDKFKNAVYKTVILLNNIIDNTYYSDETCRNSNKKHKPLGIGIQGLADLFDLIKANYYDNHSFYKKIIETLYHSALTQSNIMAKENPDEIVVNNYTLVFKKFLEYQTNKINKLKDLQLEKFTKYIKLDKYKPTHEDFTNLEKDINEFGLVNSLFVALMPTSFSSGIYNNSESYEPYTNNIYKKTYYEYDIIYYNKRLVDYLIKRKYYNYSNVLEALNTANGSIKKLTQIPEEEKQYMHYTTAKNLNIDDYIDFNNGIDAFVDQGISFNLSIKKNCNATILGTLIKLWLIGKKTIYYYRTNITVNPLTFDKNLKNRLEKIYSINCTSCQ